MAGDALGRRRPQGGGAAPAGGMRWVLSLLYYLYVAVRRVFHLTWLRLNRLLSTPEALLPKVSPTRHKVLVVGDGFAEGLGDASTLLRQGGLAGYLQDVLGKQKKQAALVGGASLTRQNWLVLNRGQTGALSKDWLPPAASAAKEQEHGQEEKEETSAESGDAAPPGAQWERVFVKGKATRDAEVVVVMLGSSDVIRGVVRMPKQAYLKSSPDGVEHYEESEMCETVKNIRTVCDALRAKGKRVVVTDLPTEGAIVGQQLGLVRKLNRQLAQYVRTTTSDPNPVLLVRISAAKVQRPANRAFDGLHLNGRGYKVLAQDVFDEADKHLRAVEWRSWKSMLGGSNSGGGGSSSGSTATNKNNKKNTSRSTAGTSEPELSGSDTIKNIPSATKATNGEAHGPQINGSSPAGLSRRRRKQH